MKLTRERKILFSVLGLGILALGADKMFFGIGGPSEAAAAMGADPVMPAPRAPGNTPDATPEAIIDAETLELLERADPSLARNPFVPPAAWNVTGVPGEPRGDPALAALGARSLTLSAVLETGAGRRAILNGHPLARGDELDGWTVLEIEEREVVIAQGDARVRLELAGPSLSRKGTVDVGMRDGR